MSLDDDDFMVKNAGQNFENDSFFLRGNHASMVGVGKVGGRRACVAWIGWVVCLRRWSASVDGVSGVRCYYYCCCYY